MTRRSKLKDLTGRLGRGARRRLRPYLSRRPEHSEHAEAPLVSVIVTASDEDAEWIQEAVGSVRDQTHRRWEMVFAPHGERSTVTRLVRQVQAEDDRIRIVDRPAETRGEARAWAVDQAQGTYLCFLQGQDLLPRKAIELGCNALETSGSDVACGKRIGSDADQHTRDLVHHRPRRAVSLADFPALISDTGLENQMFRTSFWKRSRLHIGAEDTGPSLAVEALLRADTIDVLTGRTYQDMRRAHGTPVGHQEDTTVDLLPWVATTRWILARLASTDARIRDHWIIGVLDGPLQVFLTDVERMDAAGWDAVAGLARELTDTLGDATWTLVPSESRVKLTLLLDDQHDQLADFLMRRTLGGVAVATTVVDGEIHGRYPFYDDPTVAVPRDRFVMHADETPAHLRLLDLRSGENGDLELDLLAQIRQLDLGRTTPEVTARLVDENGATVEMAVRHRDDPVADLLIRSRFQDYTAGACTVSIDPATLTSGTWRLEATVTAHGVTRETRTVDVEPQGRAGLLGTRYQPARHTSAETTVKVHATNNPDLLVLTVEPSTAVALAAASIDGSTIEVRFPDDASVGSVRAANAGRKIEAPVIDGVALLTLPDHLPETRRHWRLTALVDDQPHPIAWTDADGDPWRAGGGSLALTRNGAGMTEALYVDDTAAIDGVRLDSGTLVVEGRWVGAVPDAARLTLHSSRYQQTVAIEPATDGRFTATFDTRHDEWGLGAVAIPTGQYLFGLACGVGGDRPGRFLVSAAFLDSLLAFTTTDEFRMVPRRWRTGEAGVVLHPPVPVEAASPYAQERMREQFMQSTAPVDDTVVYLSAYGGRTATDTQLAIHEELRRTRPDLTLYWGITDRSSQVPDGGVPVIIHSPEWYDVLARAGYLIQNTDFPRWWRKRPGQRFLQTFHGYPSKSMGLRMWRAKQFTPLRLRAELDRTSADWDLILTPVPEMDVYYRTEYAYDGPIYNEGYPRDDALVQPSAADVRERTRRLLGIRPDQKVVLYAPTWRDHLAHSYTSAAMVQHLDVAEASAALGDDYVILLRGHRFNAKTEEGREHTAELIDVTDYPEVNDLILASDAAVMDYSSMRFDFALTERPMVFLVPDLADYTGGVRGFLFDYADTAPGPLLQTTDEVVAALADLDHLYDRYADRIRELNAKYQYFHDGRAAERVVTRFFDGTDTRDQ